MLNAPLPVELGPTLEEEGAPGLDPGPLGGPRPLQPRELGAENMTGWAGQPLGHWLASGLKPLQSRGLQPHSLWNPTYGSWAPGEQEVED